MVFDPVESNSGLILEIDLLLPCHFGSFRNKLKNFSKTSGSTNCWPITPLPINACWDVFTQLRFDEESIQ